MHGSQVPSDDIFTSRLSNSLLDFSKKSSRPSAAYVETAGGVHSPSPSGSSMSSALRPLRLPTILIGDSKLGGISTTRSAYDSLILAGYDVQALLLFSDSSRGLGNAEYLSKWGQEIGLAVWGLAGPSDGNAWGRPPERQGSQQEDEVRMRRFYSGLVYGRQDKADKDENPNGILSVVQHLRDSHTRRLRDLDTMGSRTLESCWWPFTQHASVKNASDVNVIDSAHDDFFSIYNPPEEGNTMLKRTLDGSASWWTQCLGHASTPLVYAATRAAARYGHVLFPMCSNEPALRLSEMLLGRYSNLNRHDKVDSTSTRREISPAPGQGWASKVFFSDDGSTGMEVAIKMAISSTAARYAPSAKTQSTKDRITPGRQAGYMGGRPSREWKVLGLKGSYHGDTIGAMDACEGNVFNDKVHWYRGRGDWLEPPKVGIKGGNIIVELPVKDDDWASLEIEKASFDYSSLNDVYDVESRMLKDPLCRTYTDFLYNWLDHLTRVQGNRYGALILEPLVMGAGGMIFIDPLFQRCFVDVIRQHPHLFNRTDPPLDRSPPSSSSFSTHDTSASQDWRGLPIIFDEVFTGLYRLGYSTPAIPLGIKPDISCLAKILTGGMVPMSVTLASQSIFETFSQSDQKADALLHGHSYTAHPIGCEVAKETLTQIESMRLNGSWTEEQSNWKRGTSPLKSDDGRESSHPWSFWDIDTVLKLSNMERVDKVMALGTVLVVELKDMSGSGGYSSTASVDLLHKLRNAPDGPFAIHARPLGNVVYFMCSLNTPKDVRTKTEQALMAALQ